MQSIGWNDGKLEINTEIVSPTINTIYNFLPISFPIKINTEIIKIENYDGFVRLIEDFIPDFSAIVNNEKFRNKKLKLIFENIKFAYYTYESKIFRYVQINFDQLPKNSKNEVIPIISVKINEKIVNMKYLNKSLPLNLYDKPINGEVVFNISTIPISDNYNFELYCHYDLTDDLVYSDGLSKSYLTYLNVYIENIYFQIIP